MCKVVLSPSSGITSTGRSRDAGQGRLGLPEVPSSFRPSNSAAVACRIHSGPVLEPSWASDRKRHGSEAASFLSSLSMRLIEKEIKREAIRVSSSRLSRP